MITSIKQFQKKYTHHVNKGLSFFWLGTEKQIKEMRTDKKKSFQMDLI